ncbi:hypothetical protein V2G26_006230 [Clonostachys chloroleuca]
MAVVAFASRLNCPHQPLAPCSAQPQLPVAGSHLPPCADWIQLQSSVWWRSVRIKDDPALLANSVATLRRWSRMMQEATSVSYLHLRKLGSSYRAKEMHFMPLGSCLAIAAWRF